MKPARGIFLFCLLILMAVLAVGGVICSTGFRPWLERRIETMLDAKGFGPADMTITRIGRDGTAVESVMIGASDPLIVRDIAVHYSLAELMRGHARAVSVGGVDLSIGRQDGQWAVNGLRPAGGTADDEGFLLALARRPGMVPVERLEIGGITATVRQGDMSAAAQNVTAELTRDPDAGWTGTWRAPQIDVVTPIEVPSLHAQGSLTAGAGKAVIEGAVESADGRWRAVFELVQTSEKFGLLLREAAMPWESGTLSVRDVWIPFGADTPITLDVQVRRVDLGALMSALTGGRVTAAGAVSGTMPLTIAKDGNLSVRRGGLRAEGPGTIVIPPELIPGQGSQTALVRDILQELHYTALSLGTEPGADGKLRLTMSVEGKNPKVSGSRPVKLNVNLTGNLLEFLQDNIRLMTRPETLLKPEDGLHEKD